MADLKKLIQQYPDETKRFVDEYGNPVQPTLLENTAEFLDSPTGETLSSPLFGSLGSYSEAAKKFNDFKEASKLKETEKQAKLAEELLKKKESLKGKSFSDLLKSDPKLAARAEKAAAENPRFAQILKSNAARLSDPKHTFAFLNSLDRMVPENPYLDKLKEFKSVLTKGMETAGEAISPYTSKIAKVYEPVASAAGKAADFVGKIPYAGAAGKLITKAAGPGIEAGLAASDYSKGRYVNALGHGLSAVGAGGMMIPHPIAKLAGAGLLGLGTGIGLASGEEPESGEKPEELDAESAKQLRRAKEQADIKLNNLKNEYEDDEQVAPSPAPSSDIVDEKMPELSEEPTPSPSPTSEASAERKPSSIGDKFMDVLGMPSAYAEDKAPVASTITSAVSQPDVAQPQPSPEPVATPPTKKKAKDKAYYKNYTTAMAEKSGIHPALLLSVIPIESGWNKIANTRLENPKAGKLGDGKATGPAQMMPGTVADFVNRAGKQKYETPEIQAHMEGLVNNLKSKINFKPYQRAFDEVQALKRKGIEPSPEQKQRLADLTNSLQARLKELSPEEHLATSAGLFKLKSLDYKLDALHPEKQTRYLIPGTRAYETHGQRLRRSYIGIAEGNPQALEESYKYLEDTEPHYQREKALYDKFNEIKDEVDEQGNPTGKKIRVHSDIALPYGSYLDTEIPDAEEYAAKKPEELSGEKTGGSPTGEPGERKVVTMQDIDNTSLSPEEKSKIDEEGYPSDISEILKLSKEEDKDRRLRDLMVLRNYLQSGTTAQMGKALQLMASGIVGAGPKKPFVTVPKLEGMETWDTLAKEGEKGVAASELMSKFAERSPSSLKSRRMQNNFISAMKRWYPEKELSRQDIDVIKSMSADEIEKQMELEKGFAKQETSLFGKTLDRKFKVQKQAQARTKVALDPIIQRLQGAQTLDRTLGEIARGEIVDSTQIARQIATDLGALLLPPGVKLGVTQQEEAQIKTLNTWARKTIQYLNEQEVRGILPASFFPQIIKELKLFKDRYKELLQKTGDGLKKEFHGLPEEYHDVSDQAIQARMEPELMQPYFVDSMYGEPKSSKLTEEQRKELEALRAKKAGK